MKDLIIFDFDSTLFNTPMPSDKHIWEEKMVRPWGSGGWWGNSKTLDTSIFNIEPNPWVIEQYDKSVESGYYKILLTGRIKPLKKSVINVLDNNNIIMDEYFCNGDLGVITNTLDFKLNVVSKFLNENIDSLERIVMYDDRDDHYPTFKKWAINTQKRTGIKIVMDKIVNGRGFYEL